MIPWLKRYVKKLGKVVVIPNAIAFDRFSFNENESWRIGSQLHIEESPIILYVGRLSPAKGVDLLVDAFSEVKMKVSDAKLILIGYMQYSSFIETLKEKVKSLGLG